MTCPGITLGADVYGGKKKLYGAKRESLSISIQGEWRDSACLFVLIMHMFCQRFSGSEQGRWGWGGGVKGKGEQATRRFIFPQLRIPLYPKMVVEDW